MADQIRFRYGIDLPPREDAEALAGHCRAVWERRGRLLPAAAALDAGSEQQIRTDLLEVASVWADLRVRLAAPPGAPGVSADVLRLLDEAEAAFGPSLAIDPRRARIAAVPGGAAGPDPETGQPPRSAWEHYDLGRYLLRSGRIEAAAAEFGRSLASRPQDFWPNFYQGLCSFRLGRAADAVAAFRTCIALAPRSAICHYNRALAYDGLGRLDLAYDDYTRATRLDPKFPPALLNRGVNLCHRGRPLEAIADFERGLRTDPLDRETAGRLRYNLALAQLAAGDRPSAEANAEEAVRLGCGDATPLRAELRTGRAATRPDGPPG